MRNQLIEDGVDPNRCYIEGCSYNDEYGIEIHHIIPREFSYMLTKLDIHSPKNLIPLCPNHHKMANAFDWNKLLNVNPDEWRKIISEFLRNPNPPSTPKESTSNVVPVQESFL